MGIALARAALRRGAEVALVMGPTALTPPDGARTISVTTAAEMRDAVVKEYDRCTAVIMAAAVADYHAAFVAERKIKRGQGALELRLEPNPDILKELGQNRNRKWLIGFAAETEDLTGNAQKKLHEKNLDMVIANNVTEGGSGFDGDTNIATIVDRTGAICALPLMSKDDLADKIYDHFLALKSRR
jgi:phosphopantothenoylcysteine decarboxylase/phosphopantothenate--cysteine ligase